MFSNGFPVASARMMPFDRTSGATEWTYDAEADTLYVRFGPPRPATGLDFGEGVVVRYDGRTGKVVGVTIVGIGARIRDATDVSTPRGDAG